MEEEAKVLKTRQDYEAENTHEEETYSSKNTNHLRAAGSTCMLIILMTSHKAVPLCQSKPLLCPLTTR
jgi:hypothetical protein